MLKSLLIILQQAVRLTLLLCLDAVLFVGLHHDDPLQDIDAVLASGELVVLTRNGPTTYYLDADGPAGFEYELASAFAEYLGVEPRFVEVESQADIVPQLLRGNGDMVAAGLTRTPVMSELFSFSPGYQRVSKVAVYRRGARRPRSIADLENEELGVVAGSTSEETLARLQRDYPGLVWQARQQSVPELLRAVANGELDYAVTDEHILSIHRRYMPDVLPAFALPGSELQLAWAFPQQESRLRLAADHFFYSFSQNGRLSDLRERHYSHVRDYDFVGSYTFMRHVDRRLPPLEQLFREAAEQSGFDWRLLAAVGYQESHWNADAVSPTGVRGLMMLTRATASDLGVDDRRDPRESVLGGARYLAETLARMPERIPEDDRLWMALAAYNVGWGHLEDARVLTETMGGDPDRWLDVKRHLPLLADKRWYRLTRRGYARGWEPVQYVENIRSYYEILLWLTREPTQIALTSDTGGSTAERHTQGTR